MFGAKEALERRAVVAPRRGGAGLALRCRCFSPSAGRKGRRSRGAAHGPSGRKHLSNADAAKWQRLSHEIRTPLNAILGNVELLLDGTAGPLAPDARVRLGEVQTAGRELLKCVQTLLLWSELKGTGMRPDAAPIDLIELVRETVPKTRRLEVRPHGARLIVPGDHVWLRIMVETVAAMSAAPDAPLTVTLDASATRRTLEFACPDFSPDEVAPLQIALIDAIVDLHGGCLSSSERCLTVCWSGAAAGAGGEPARSPGAAWTNGAVLDRSSPRD